MKKKDSLYIVIPAYNEAENIAQVVNEWYPVVNRYSADGLSRLVIIDDGSRDGTYEILQKEVERRPLLEVITKANSGHGASVLCGYKYALEKNAAYIFQTDSDGQTLPSEFDVFWHERERYDMVIGWRRGRLDGFSRLVVTKVLKLVIWICFGVWVTDANAPFRLLKTAPLRQIINLIPEGYNLSNVLVSVIYAKRKNPCRYIPITFRQRQGGVNSINLRKICKIGVKALRDFRRIGETIK